MTSYGDANKAEDAAVTADTETLLHTVTMDRDAVLKKIMFCYAGVVDAKASTGYIELKISNVSGPFVFPIGGGPGGATNTGHLLNAGEIAIDIGVSKSSIIEIYITLNEAAVDAHGGLVFVA